MKQFIFIAFILSLMVICFYGACNRLREDVKPLDNGDIAKDSSSYIYKDTAK